MPRDIEPAGTMLGPQKRQLCKALAIFTNRRRGFAPTTLLVSSPFVETSPWCRPPVGLRRRRGKVSRARLAACNTLASRPADLCMPPCSGLAELRSQKISRYDNFARITRNQREKRSASSLKPRSTLAQREHFVKSERCRPCSASSACSQQPALYEKNASAS